VALQWREHKKNCHLKANIVSAVYYYYYYYYYRCLIQLDFNQNSINWSLATKSILSTIIQSPVRDMEQHFGNGQAVMIIERISKQMLIWANNI
jgi:hypothetical protein